VEWRAREVFEDPKLGAGEYSLLLGATFQAADRTLRENELQDYQAAVVGAVGKIGARLRSQAQ
jgi:phenylalanyl-tRNA synthetase beta chain